MKTQCKRAVRRRKRNRDRHLKNDHAISPGPVFSAARIAYRAGSRVSAIASGGIGVMLKLADRLGLPREINTNLRLLKIHKPYFESDHVQTILLNVLNGGDCLDDIELMRNDPALVGALGAVRIPDPTTVGDFLRRFSELDNLKLLEILRRVNARAFELAGCADQEAILDVDGTIQRTYGEKKQGMALSYKGLWGFAPLIVTEATTGAHVCMVNRSGNSTSHAGADTWIDNAIASVKHSFRSVCLRGDSAFNLTFKFDEWTERGVRFVFACPAHQNLVKMAENLTDSEWTHFNREQRERRRVGRNFKQEYVIERGYRDMRLAEEHLAEFEYFPSRCKRGYRMIVLRKTIRVEQGQKRLFDDVRYLFYVTNTTDDNPDTVVRFAHQRCNHENRIEQLKNGVHALHMPTSDFQANWAYMILLALAWNLKCYLAFMLPDAESRSAVIRMEFKRFLNQIIRIPCQIVLTGRCVIYRFLGYSDWLERLLCAFERVSRLTPALD